jgi:hypothetical protein
VEILLTLDDLLWVIILVLNVEMLRLHAKSYIRLGAQLQPITKVAICTSQVNQWLRMLENERG